MELEIEALFDDVTLESRVSACLGTIIGRHGPYC